MKPILTAIAAGVLIPMLAPGQTQRYTVIDLGAVGPMPDQPYFIANTGLTAGAAQASDGAVHAVIWYGGHKLDIAANRLGGPNSQAFGVNVWGQVVGEAQTSVANSEDFCGFSALGLRAAAKACRPFVWQNGMIAELPNTLGGANAVANVIDIWGDVAGFAETNQHEAGCPVGQFKPVIWRRGLIQQLPTLAGDLDGGAFGINDFGRAVGVSGSCAPFNPNSQVYLFESHALLWENGAAKDLGNLGGTGGFGGNHACSINNWGQVVGHSDLPGDTTTHAFLWTKEMGRMQDLGTLAGDFASVALSINDSGEVVGSSFNTQFVFRAFVRRNGVMMDLNTLIPADSPLYLQLAASINASGEIVGVGQDDEGKVHGLLAVPVHDGNHFSDALGRQALFPSEFARPLLLRRLGIRAR